jgi:hypothetical protein
MFADSFCDTLTAAMAEVDRRRSQNRGEQMITRIEDSPYGGFRVRSFPAEFIVDSVSEPGAIPLSRFSALAHT